MSSPNITLAVDTRAFTAAIHEFARATGKALEEATKQQAATMTGVVMGLTPPSDGEGAIRKLSLADRKKGDATVESDIRSLFIPTRAPEKILRAWVTEGIKPKSLEGAPPQGYVMDAASMAAWHQRARSPKTGRTWGGQWTGVGRGSKAGRANVNVAWAPPGLIKRYVKQEQAKVGKLASGWLSSAIYLGTSTGYTPKWVERHGQSGSRPRILARPGYTLITVRNEMRHNAQDMARRIRRAVSYMEGNVNRQIAAVVRKQARASKLGRK